MHITKVWFGVSGAWRRYAPIDWLTAPAVPLFMVLSAVCTYFVPFSFHGALFLLWLVAAHVVTTATAPKGSDL
jgi:hypothetical protein